MRPVLLGSLSALFGAWLLLGATCAHAEAEFDPVLAELGAETFPRYCGSCHGLQGRGDGPAAGALLRPPADLTRIAARRGGSFPGGEIARFIDGRFAVAAHGSREMPIWGERFGDAIPDSGIAEEMTRGKIAVLVEYLKSIQQKD
jgi:mono/diheme cytochrome c family protein